MESLKNIVMDIQSFVYGGVRTLPLTIAGTLLILGLMTANYAMLFFLVAYLVFIPFISSVLNYGVDALLPFIGLNSWFKGTTSDVCGLKIPFVTSSKNVSTATITTVFSTPWVSMIAFFFGYILTNAVAIYNRPGMDEEIEVNTGSETDIVQKQNNRASQAITAIVSIAIVTIIVLSVRIFLTGCESKWGALWNTLIFGNLGFAWYKTLSSVGQDRLSDLFGIANRLLDPSAIENAPVACVPIPF